ncbi:Girdin [Cytospora mali]|uniref:Girdin n=1 Tax=Cytospora mali TaxID=578113 RepID=A0A194V3V4_CYTMA|nr:Girdin [Valsa mali var. pyri (nom. inval.)]
MPFSPAAQVALLKWVNNFPVDGHEPAESMGDLADGIILSQMLRDLDPTYDTSELDKNVGSSKWLTQKRNLQSVYKGLFKYMRQEAPECVPLIQVADFRAIAENPDAEGLTQLVAVFLATAVMNSNEDVRTKAISKVQGPLNPAEQNEIRRILEQKQIEMMELAAKAEEEGAADRDPDLENEEERLRLEANLEKKVRELDTAMKRYADLNTRHSHLQESHDEIKAKLAEVETELAEIRKLHGADESQKVQALQRKIDEQAALIAGQEEEIDNYQTKQRHMEVELERFKASSQEGQDYKDKYDELHHQMQELERKANAADRYKQKLATQRNLEQEVATLQYELESRRELDTQLKKAMFERDRLHMTEKEMLAAMTQIEQSLNDERDRKDQYRQLYEELKAEFAQLDHQNNVNEKYIEDMKEQLGAVGEVPRAPSPGSETGGLNSLEHELQQTTNDLSKVKLLEAEVEVLRHGAATVTQADDLRRELERVKAERDVAVKNYESVFEKHGIAQEQIEALIKNMTGEGLVNGIDEALKFGSLAILTSTYYRHVAFSNLRNQYSQASKELAELKVQNRKLEEVAKDKDRDMLAMKTDCALLEDPRYYFEYETDDDYDTVDAVGQDRLDALDRLKQSDQLIAASLRSELEALRSKYNSLEIENNMHKSQLLDALVAKEKLSKERELEGHSAVAPEGVDQAAYDEKLKDYRSKAEKLRDRVILQKEQLEKADQERYDLQKRIKALESGSALAAQKAAHEHIINNLKRENAMISTAWYDLTSRLQSNHVVLQRKDQPKSWLNKQRQMVNGDAWRLFRSTAQRL